MPFGLLVYSGRIRTLVAIATYSSHRLIMGKVEICKCFFLSQWRYLELFFTKMFIELSSTLHMTFVQIGVFDWLSGRQKGSIFVKTFKNLLRNHMEEVADTWHTCLGHYLLQELCFFYFWLDKNSGCYGNLKFP